MSAHTRKLKQFYDEQADKFSGTRQRHWPEFDVLLEYINTYDLGSRRKLRILELGCGDGRFSAYLEKHCKHKFHYTGVDFSSGLIDIACKKHPEYEFVCADMLDYISKPKQESIDIVVSIASFQHLESKKDRLRLLKNMYRILKYGGLHLSINRCYSDWFQKKFSGPIKKALIKMIVSFGRRDRHNLLIPFRNQGKVYHRLYHIFRPGELSYLSKISGFVFSPLRYINKEGTFTNNENEARNSFCLQRKACFLEEKD